MTCVWTVGPLTQTVSVTSSLCCVFLPPVVAVTYPLGFEDHLQRSNKSQQNHVSRNITEIPLNITIKADKRCCKVKQAPMQPQDATCIDNMRYKDDKQKETESLGREDESPPLSSIHQAAAVTSVMQRRKSFWLLKWLKKDCTKFAQARVCFNFLAIRAF